MPIRVECPTCHQAIKAPSKYRGKKIKCPGCKEAFIVPASKPKPQKQTARAVVPPPLPPPSPTHTHNKESSLAAALVAAQDSIETQVHCPFCDELIKSRAKKCKHCGEYLDPTLREKNLQESQAGAQSPVAVQVNLPEQKLPKWSRGTAALLSFIIPGAGQIYKGQVINGIAWFVLAVFGYMAMILPGLIVHMCSIFGAVQGSEYE